MTSSPASPLYVLIHGAWHGGWCWGPVAERLRRAGAEVHAPTLPGLGERAGELSPDITLDTFIQDMQEYLSSHDLRNVVLVGHSFGGLVIAGLADRVRERISRLVYLDAFLLPAGTSTFATLPEGMAEKLERAAQPAGGIPPVRPEQLGLTDPADQEFVGTRMTPHPVGTYRSPLKLNHPMGNGLPAAYLRCAEPPFKGTAASYDWARRTFGEAWTWRDLPAGHDAMVSHPDLVADALLNLGRPSRTESAAPSHRP